MAGLARRLVIENSRGLHGRASGRLVETAKAFSADIRLEREGNSADCKSILDVMAMACCQGSEITVRAVGGDARQALDAIEELIRAKFGEE